MFCFNDHCRVAEQKAFHVLLETVENFFSDKGDEAVKEAVAGLHEAVADAERAAAAAADSRVAKAKGAAEVAWVADVAPPEATSAAEGHADA